MLNVVFGLLRCGTVLLDDWCVTCQDSGVLETSGTSLPVTWHHILEEQRSQL